MNGRRAGSLVALYPVWAEHGVTDDETVTRWVRVLRAWAMPSVVDVDGRSSGAWMDTALVSGALKLNDLDPDGPTVLAWLDSGLPIGHVEHYLPAGLTVTEAGALDTDGTYDQAALDVLAALLEGEDTDER